MNTALFRRVGVALLLASAACSQSGRTETSRMDVRGDGNHLSLEAKQGVVSVLAASPAGRFGVKEGDRVLRVDGQPVTSVTALTSALTGNGKTTVPVVVQRDGNEQVLTVATAPSPPSPPSPPDRP